MLEVFTGNYSGTKVKYRGKARYSQKFGLCLRLRRRKERKIYYEVSQQERFAVESQREMYCSMYSKKTWKGR